MPVTPPPGQTQWGRLILQDQDTAALHTDGRYLLDTETVPYRRLLGSDWWARSDDRADHREVRRVLLYLGHAAKPA